ncbi:MAG TPA: phosphopantetheine-binding protein [Victivallis vadensis]|nr:phosphopantetheine-binding protein [Victivallis vadensis]
MTREEIIAEINSIFVEQFELAPAELTAEKKIFDDLGLDSLDIVDLMIGLQRKFGIPLRQNEEIRKIVTLGDVYEFFVKLAKERPEFAANLKK